MYTNMVEICWYNHFGSWFGLWDIVEGYAVLKRDIRKLPEDLKFIFEIYKEALNLQEIR